MKTRNLKISIWMAMVLFALSWSVNGSESFPLAKERPNIICHLIKQKTLLEVVDQMAKMSGIKFNVNPALEHDEINQRLAADDWREAVAQLLQGYNYTMVSDRNVIKTVVITGRSGSGLSTASVSDSNAEASLDEVASIPLGNELILDLPIGQYTVKRDNFADNYDDDSTWIAYLEGEAERYERYKVYLSQVDAGDMNIPDSDGVNSVEMLAGGY